MLGLIQDRPLLLSDVLTHAALYHANTPVVSRRRDGSFFHSTWSGIEVRVRSLANALRASGVRPGDRVATLAWNNHRHLEAYFAITAIGAVCHPINPRLFPNRSRISPRTQKTWGFSTTWSIRRWRLRCPMP